MMISIYVTTWNVGGKYPDKLNFNELLDISINPNERKFCDMYVIGLQEVNAAPQNVISNFFNNDPWVKKLKEFLKPFDYIALKVDQLQGIQLTVFVKREHLYQIRDVESEYVRTGLGGIWGNKGAVATRMTIYGCSTCLVNSHLAAHDEMYKERCGDYNRIKNTTKFSVKVSKSIFEHDYVFWFGDLNFRLFKHESDENLSQREIRDLIEKDSTRELISCDQLANAMCLGDAFSELVERFPQFPPTFKFEPGTSDYDMKRRPAWCDRILYKNKAKTLKNCIMSIEQISYKSHPNYTLSDHKPVTSEFQLKVKEILIKHPNVTSRRSSQIPKSNLDYAQIPFDLTETLTNVDNPETETYDDIDLVQTFEAEDITHRQVKFAPFSVWNNSEDNEVEYFLPAGYTTHNADWIGVFHEEFSGLDEYLAFDWVTSSSHSHHSNDPHMRKIKFSASIDLPLDGQFVLMYFKLSGTWGHASLLGISDPFHVIKRTPSPRPDTID